MLLPEPAFVLRFAKLRVNGFIGKVLSGIMDLFVYVPQPVLGGF